MSDQLNFVDCLRLVKGGLATWKEKPHNAKWWKRIDGTPIPNDLCVCIAEAFVAEAALRAETPAPREPKPALTEAGADDIAAAIYLGNIREVREK